MDLITLLRICKLYRGLGDSVADQLHAVADERDFSDLNPNALKLMKTECLSDVHWLSTDELLREEIDEVIEQIDEYLGDKT